MYCNLNYGINCMIIKEWLLEAVYSYVPLPKPVLNIALAMCLVCVSRGDNVPVPPDLFPRYLGTY